MLGDNGRIRSALNEKILNFKILSLVEENCRGLEDREGRYNRLGKEGLVERVIGTGNNREVPEGGVPVLLSVTRCFVVLVTVSS